MDRAFASASSASAPTAPASPSIGYPTAGNPGSGTPPTKPGAYWYYMITEEIRNVITSAGLTPDQGTLTQLKAALDALYAPAVQGYMLVRDEKAQNTAGGGSTAATTNARTLNTVSANTISGASLAANQITLPAGTYRINASAPVYGVDESRVSLYNVTDAAAALLGTSENSISAAQTRSFVSGRFTIASAKVFELRHFTGTTVATNGLGFPINSGGVEVYSVVEIIKE